MSYNNSMFSSLVDVKKLTSRIRSVLIFYAPKCATRSQLCVFKRHKLCMQRLSVARLLPLQVKRLQVCDIKTTVMSNIYNNNKIFISPIKMATAQYLKIQ